jgi:hypothetical protein
VLSCLVSTKDTEASPDATTANKKRGAKIDRLHSSIEQVRCEAGAGKLTLCQCLMRLCKSGVGARTAKGI